jgi:C_GCAxxG_C_C family probable redox protein
MENDNEVERIAGLIQAKAENLYEAHRFCCSESILLVINKSFGLGLAEEVASSMADGFCGGMSAGCVCGALSSSVMALGLILSPRKNGGMRKKEFQSLCKKMHDQFEERFGSTCCRCLVEDKQDNRRKRMKFCGNLTGEAAAILGRLLLEAKPALRNQVDFEYLGSLDSRFTGFVKKLF